ncbi:MAG: glycosyltransferase family 2 protein [Cyanobacteria bacterium NC_groundwater_1444_Ag_S-0.65um_54_12]|nr:glycosyltransferase family 2 protein [Cyanobacteria bacterium NC_groundwater_1444_Ag_S-0.65um_54_12]
MKYTVLQVHDLAVIVVNFNQAPYLARCLASLYVERRQLSLEIIVVDNASSDDSVNLVSERFPEVKLLVNNENRGFAKANNQAINITQARYVLLLNNDTEVLPGSLTELLVFADAHPVAGAVGCMLLRSDGSQHRLPASFFSPLVWLPERTRRVSWLVGAALLLKRDALLAVGGLAEEFFFYYEDADLCYRLRNKGWHCYYCPDARIVHHEKASTSLFRSQALYHLYRGRLLLTSRHFPWAYSFVRSWLWLVFTLDLARACHGRTASPLLQVADEIRALLATDLRC